MMFIKNTFILRDVINNSRNLFNSNRCITITSCTQLSKSAEEKLGLPPKPKKPLTPYFRFMKQIRPEIVEQNPKANVGEVVKTIALKWRTVNDDLKNKLEEEYKKELMSYIENRAKYNDKLTNTQKTEIKQLKLEMNEMKERRALRKRIKELGRPKRPTSSFFKFVVNERSLQPIPKNMIYKDWLKRVTEKWMRLSDEEKDKYKLEAKKEFEKYKQELIKWETKMISEGHMGVVRQDTLIDREEKQQPKKRTTA